MFSLFAVCYSYSLIILQSFCGKRSKSLKNSFLLLWKCLLCVLRYYSNNSASVKVDKSILSELRKRTGYGFSKCLDALKLNKNDINEAEKWLAEQAQKEGWMKAEKLKERTMSQGLIGASVEGNIAAMVEVGCETDFVARNDAFKELVSVVTNAALIYRTRIIKQNKLLNSFGDEDIAHLREVVPIQKLGNVTMEESGNAPLQDIIVDNIGRLGENIKVKRAVTVATSSCNMFGIYGHGNPSGSIDNFVYGQYACIVTLRPSSNANKVDISNLARGLAQHVTGMNPKVIDLESESENSEDALLLQEYLLDDTLTVREILSRNEVEIVDFLRYECGE